MGDVAIEANRLGLRWNLPFGGAEENADMAAVDGGDARGHGFGLEGMINSGEEDGVIGDMNDGAAAGQVGDDLFFLG